MDRRAVVRHAFEIGRTLVLTVIIYVVIQTFIAQPFKIEQESMERTLEPDQFVLVEKVSALWSSYERGSIVVFVPPDGWRSSGTAPFIKRVIGIAGDTVEIRADGYVYVNDVKLDEPYLYATDGRPEGTDGVEVGHHVEVGDGELYVLGDHRSNSLDSRRYGSINVADVIGRAVVRYWPIDSLAILDVARHPELDVAGR
jgi:signal peptidase I